MSASVAAGETAYEVRAFNTAAASENKIHDDAVARRFGFHGALVPGVEVYAYMAHLPVARWGRAWLESGAAECRFLKPVYDGAVARVTASAEDGGLALSVESAGECCATGHAFMPPDYRPAPAVDALPAGTPPVERPPASKTSLAMGSALGIRPLTIDRAMLSTYLDEIRETDPIPRRRAGASRPDPPPRQSGAGAERRARPMDSRRQQGAPPRHRARRRATDAPLQGHRERRQQGPRDCRVRRDRDCRRRKDSN